MHMCTHTSVYPCLYTGVRARVHSCTYACIHVHTCARVHTRRHSCKPAGVHTHTQAHIHIRAHLVLHMCVSSRWQAGDSTPPVTQLCRAWGWAHPHLSPLLGDEEAASWARGAPRCSPVGRTHSAQGQIRSLCAVPDFQGWLPGGAQGADPHPRLGAGCASPRPWGGIRCRGHDPFIVLK